MSDHTGFYDSDGAGIVIGSIVRKAVTCNIDIHGKWAEYEIKARGMVPILSYKQSEKGIVLPDGTLASPLSEEYDQKMFLFARNLKDLRPIENMVVINRSDEWCN